MPVCKGAFWDFDKHPWAGGNQSYTGKMEDGRKHNSYIDV